MVYDFLNRHPLLHLHERLERKIQQGKSVQLTADDVDWLAASGAYEAIALAAARELKSAAIQRLRDRGEDLSILERLEGRGADAEPDDQEPPAEPNKPKGMPDVYSVKTLAEWWGVSTTSIYTLIASGKLRSFKLGNKLVRIQRGAVEEYEREHMGRR